MGFGGISLWQLLIVLVIVLLIFGTKRIRSLGGDLGGAVRSFRSAMGGQDDDMNDIVDGKDKDGSAPQIKGKETRADADFEPAEKRESDAATR